MWIIQFLPAFVTHLIVLVGLAGIILTVVPIIWKLVPGLALYKAPIQILSVTILCFGIYLEGGLANDERWKLKVSELEVKLAKTEALKAKVNTEIVTEYVTKKQIIKQKGDTVTEYIDREVVKYDTSCPIPESVVKAHNAAASGDTAPLTALPASTPVHTEALNNAARPAMILPKK
jgi:hypothetical protein